MSSAFGGSSSATTKGVGDEGGNTTRTQPGKEKFKFQYITYIRSSQYQSVVLLNELKKSIYIFVRITVPRAHSHTNRIILVIDTEADGEN